MIRVFRLLWLLALPGLVWMSGCAEGESVPLVPAGPVCEYPLDTDWQYLNDICGSKAPLDSVWPSGQLPVVVGERGLLIECTARSQWSVVDLPIQGDLKAIAANDNGDLVAAGENGALAVRKEGIWEILDLHTDITWEDVRSNGQEIWLAGDNGTLARGVPGGTWTFVDYPDTSDLSAVCAFADSIFVGNFEGDIKILVEGQWTDLSPSPNWPVTSIVHSDDGHLWVMAGSLQVRNSEGWQYIDAPGHYNGFGHLKIRDNYLWVPHYTAVRMDLSSEPWPSRLFATYGTNSVVSPGPVDEALGVSHAGEIVWLSDEGAENVEREWDTAGFFNIRTLSRLADGTVVVSSPQALFRITPNGVFSVHSLAPEVEASLSLDSRLTGASIDDFYLAENMKVQHILNGSINSEIDLPDDLGGFQNFAVNDAGHICVALSYGVVFREGNQWEVWLGHYAPMVTLTQQQNFVITWDSGALYQSATGLISINTEMPSVLVKESEPGVLDFMSPDYRYVQWNSDTGIDGFTYLDPLPGCNEVIFRTIADTPRGFLMAGRNNSMILRIPDNPYQADWKLVAGPCKYEISSLETLEDGSLVAVGGSDKVIMTYPPQNF